ncbi:hypothetical protein L228DRAFT_241357 [Xylona heveae TC161]|uniref:Uncharacterized protein n=1 Tax=Xylona heveae (strain CBS 132557 / TC161) TaxID=1328760 RepID=A0A164ZVS5_XYLHT|nr:hypothetical protein L228DRAFT_241357 [Xylona heveae TC161]KZF19593.1 hypothetical protein L228DRAFT_241357 [Xylona heveae TC161]
MLALWVRPKITLEIFTTCYYKVKAQRVPSNDIQKKRETDCGSKIVDGNIVMDATSKPRISMPVLARNNPEDSDIVMWNVAVVRACFFCYSSITPSFLDYSECASESEIKGNAVTIQISADQLRRVIFSYSKCLLSADTLTSTRQEVLPDCMPSPVRILQQPREPRSGKGVEPTFAALTSQDQWLNDFACHLLLIRGWNQPNILNQRVSEKTPERKPSNQPDDKAMKTARLDPQTLDPDWTMFEYHGRVLSIPLMDNQANPHR